MNIFFDESDNIRFDKDSSEFFECKPFVANKSLFFLGFWFRFSCVFYEKEEYVFVDHRRSFDMRGDKGIVYLVHEFDDMKLSDWEASFFRNLPYRRLHCFLILFDMPLWKNILESSTSLFKSKHEYFKFRSFFSIHNTTSTLFMEFCHSVVLYWNGV